MKRLLLALLIGLGSAAARAQIPVTDVASLVQNEVDQIQVLAQWAESIAQLKVQVDQLNQQLSLQTDLHAWTGSPVAASASVSLSGLGSADLTASFGQSDAAILGAVSSLASLANTSQGTYPAVGMTDLSGQSYQPDDETYRRYSVLDAKQSNLDQVSAQTLARETDLQTQIAATLVQLKNASTQSETQKLSAQLAALNSQLGQVDGQRRRSVDDLAEQKIANDSRVEEERMAAADLAARNDYLANQKITAFMQTLQLRQNPNAN